MDDVDLPPMPQPASRSRPALLTRKRTIEDYNDDVAMSAASSDPALFSSDENGPGAEDYSTKRRKKVYAGSWFQHRAKANREDKKREFKRNYDSGIFMGSESSEPPSSDSLGSLEEELMRDQRRMELDLQTAPKAHSSRSRPLLRSSSLPFRHAQPDVSPQHRSVTHIVQCCLDRGEESVDLSSMSLASLPAEITSLTTLTKHSNLVSGMLDHGDKLEAELRLFLGNNLLRCLPCEVLDLTNLRLLSLRHNKITSLPPGIRNLINLETLNVAGNKLTCLPFEVLELVRFHHLKTITAEPNPWLPRPDDGDTDGLTRWLRFTTEPLLYRWHGSNTMLTSLGHKPPPSSVPPLTEMALRSLARLGPHPRLTEHMPPDTPASILAALETLYDSSLAGGYQCSRCDRRIVQAGCEQIEWWVVGRECELDGSPEQQTEAEADPWKPLHVDLQQALPFKRLYCQQGCKGTKNDWCDDALQKTGMRFLRDP